MSKWLAHIFCIPKSESSRTICSINLTQLDEWLESPSIKTFQRIVNHQSLHRLLCLRQTWFRMRAYARTVLVHTIEAFDIHKFVLLSAQSVSAFTRSSYAEHLRLVEIFCGYEETYSLKTAFNFSELYKVIKKSVLCKKSIQSDYNRRNSIQLDMKSCLETNLIRILKL